MQRNIVVAFRGIKTNDHKSFILTPEVEKAFEELKIAFTTTPVLKHFNPELPTRIETDASGYAIGGILGQLHEGVWHLVAHYSRKQIPAETRYDTHDKELLSNIVRGRIIPRIHSAGSLTTNKTMVQRNEKPINS